MDLQLVILEGGDQVLLAKDGEMLLVEAVSTLGIWSAGSAPHQLALVQQDVQELGKGETPGGVSDRDNVGYQLAASAVLPHHQLLILLPDDGCFESLHVQGNCAPSVAKPTCVQEGWRATALIRAHIPRGEDMPAGLLYTTKKNNIIPDFPCLHTLLESRRG